MKADPWWDPLPHRLGSICSLLQCTRLMATEVMIPIRRGLLRPGSNGTPLSPLYNSTPPMYVQQGTADVATRHEYLVGFLAAATTTSGRTPPLLQRGGSAAPLSGSITIGAGPGGLRDDGGIDGVGRDCSGAGVTYFEVPGGFHDLNHDKATPECLQRILAWLEEQLQRRQ